MTHPLEKWLADERQAGRRITRRTLAREVGCSTPRITQIAGGETPSLALAVKLSKRTGIPVEQFLQGTR